MVDFKFFFFRLCKCVAGLVHFVVHSQRQEQCNWVEIILCILDDNGMNNFEEEIKYLYSLFLLLVFVLSTTLLFSSLFLSWAFFWLDDIIPGNIFFSQAKRKCFVLYYSFFLSLQISVSFWAYIEFLFTFYIFTFRI